MGVSVAGPETLFQNSFFTVYKVVSFPLKLVPVRLIPLIARDLDTFPLYTFTTHTLGFFF